MYIGEEGVYIGEEEGVYRGCIQGDGVYIGEEGVYRGEGGVYRSWRSRILARVRGCILYREIPFFFLFNYITQYIQH